MIYQDIIADGRGYGKPHVTWVKDAWRAFYRGCYCIDRGSPSEAASGVLVFYKSNYPAGLV